MISTFLLSQIFAAVSFLLGIASFQFKNRSHTLFCLSATQLFAAVTFWLLGAYVAMAVLLISSVRFFVSIFIQHTYMKYMFIGVILLAGVVIYQFPFDIVSILAGILGTLGAFSSEPQQMRKFFMGGTALAVLYSVLIFSPVTIFAESCYFMSNTFSYWRFYLKKQSVTVE